MTLLDTLIANSLDTTTVVALLNTTSEFVDDDTLATTVTTSVTSLLDSVEVPHIYITTEMSSYVETMPTEELTKGLELLDEKGLEFQVIESTAKEEQPVKSTEKVLKIGQKQR